MACIDKQQEMETARRSRFRSQQSKDMSGDIERRKSKLGSISAAKTRAASAAGLATPSAETADQRDSKRGEDLRTSEAKALLEKSKRESEAEKTKEKPKIPKSDLESGTAKESQAKVKVESETGKGRESSVKMKIESDRDKSKTEAQPVISKKSPTPVRESETKDSSGKASGAGATSEKPKLEPSAKRN